MSIFNITKRYDGTMVLKHYNKEFEVNEEAVKHVKEHKDELNKIAIQLYTADDKNVDYQHPRHHKLQAAMSKIVYNKIREEFGPYEGEESIDFLSDKGFLLEHRRPSAWYYIFLAVMEYFDILDDFLDEYQGQIEDAVEWGKVSQRKLRTQIKALRDKPYTTASDWIGIGL